MDNKKLRKHIIRLLAENKVLKRQIWYDMQTAINKANKEKREVVKNVNK